MKKTYNSPQLRTVQLSIGHLMQTGSPYGRNVYNDQASSSKDVLSRRNVWVEDWNDSNE